MTLIIAIATTEDAATAIKHFGHNNVKDVDLAKFPQNKLPAIVVKYIQRQIKEGVPYVVVPQDKALLGALDEAGVTYTKADEGISLLGLICRTEVPDIDLAGAIPTPSIRPELSGGMVVYVDDIRDPRRFLPSEQCKDVWWIKHWWAAKNFLLEHEDEIEVLHLDHYLGDETGLLVEHIIDGKLTDTHDHVENTRDHMRDREHTGTELFHMVRTRQKHGRGFQNLKYIYLHSNASEITQRLMVGYQEQLADQGIALILNTQGW